jgi:hypothetical protein
MPPHPRPTCTFKPTPPELPQQDKVSTTDPDAAYFSKGDRASKLGYFDNYLMDNASCVIVGVEATVASSSQEVISARKMVADCVEKFGARSEDVSR